MPDPAMCWLWFHHKLALDYFVLHGVETAESIGEEHSDGDVMVVTAESIDEEHGDGDVMVVTAESIDEELYYYGDVVLGFERRHSHQEVDSRDGR